MNISIKNVPEAVVANLRGRARRNHRSLQGELLDILERTVHARPLSLSEARDRLKDMGYSTGEESREMIREDRNRDAGKRC